MNIKASLRENLSQQIAKATGLDSNEVLGLIEKPKNQSFGDFAFPCFTLAKITKSNPKIAAEELKNKIELPKGISVATATGPFLNFKIERSSFIKKVINQVLSDDFTPKPKSEKVILDYSSPNIAKPFHVGHLRATLIGNCLDKVYRHLGYRTTSINHLGDWGTQFGFVWAGCKLWGKPENETVKELVGLYKKATSLREEQEKGNVSEENRELPDVNEIAREYFIRLEENETEAYQFWQWCLNISLDYLKNAYKRLNVEFDHFTGESFYSDKLEAVQTKLEQSNLLRESKGALGVELDEELGFARIYTPDGRSLYLMRDLAAVDYRKKEFNFDKAVYVVGIPQTLHFKQLKSLLAKLGDETSDKIIHVGFGHILGMKTRGEGGVIELDEFLDEAYDRALLAYREQVKKRPEGLDETQVAEAVSLSAIVFSNLSKNRLKDVNFKWKHALEFQGDSGPYILYAYARTSSILKKAAEQSLESNLDFDSKLISEESAFFLADKISEFEDVLEQLILEHEPAHLTNYALELSKAFSKAYLDLKVIGVDKDLARARLALFKAKKQILEICIDLLGFRSLEQM